MPQVSRNAKVSSKSEMSADTLSKLAHDTLRMYRKPKIFGALESGESVGVVCFQGRGRGRGLNERIGGIQVLFMLLHGFAFLPTRTKP